MRIQLTRSELQNILEIYYDCIIKEFYLDIGDYAVEFDCKLNKEVIK